MVSYRTSLVEAVAHDSRSTAAASCAASLAAVRSTRHLAQRKMWTTYQICCVLNQLCREVGYMILGLIFWLKSLCKGGRKRPPIGSLNVQKRTCSVLGSS